MPTFKINDAEWAAHLDLPGDCLKVYCEIRRHMDFESGIAGHNSHAGGKHFNERAFLELLDIPSSPGRPRQQATRKRVRYLMQVLERNGLLERIGPLVFRLPLAQSDHSASERWGQRSVSESAEAGPPGADSWASGAAQGSAEGGARGGAKDSDEVGPEVGPTTGVPDNSVSKDTECAHSRCPHREILKLWADIMPELRQPIPDTWRSDRAAYKDLGRRWKELMRVRHRRTGQLLYTDRESGLAWWRTFLEYLSKSDFLMGRDHKQWHGFTLDWLLKKNNFNKCLEGNYHD